MRSNMIDVGCYFLAETALAILISDDGDQEKAIWLPKSQTEITPTDDPRVISVSLPEWLAIAKGLI